MSYSPFSRSFLLCLGGMLCAMLALMGQTAFSQSVVEGTVWIDIDNDGTINEPLALAGSSGTTINVHANVGGVDQLVASTTTSSNGSYNVNLPDGIYTVSLGGPVCTDIIPLGQPTTPLSQMVAVNASTATVNFSYNAVHGDCGYTGIRVSFDLDEVGFAFERFNSQIAGEILNNTTVELLHGTTSLGFFSHQSDEVYFDQFSLALNVPAGTTSVTAKVHLNADAANFQLTTPSTLPVLLDDCGRMLWCSSVNFGVIPTETPDSDGDKIPDSWDNCPNTVNPLQYDYDEDGLGDACQPDKTVSGAVFLDINSNGVLDEDLAVAGIRGVVVRVYQMIDGSFTSVGLDTTDTRGEYSLRVPSGQFEIRIDRRLSGFVEKECFNGDLLTQVTTPLTQIINHDEEAFFGYEPVVNPEPEFPAIYPVYGYPLQGTVNRSLRVPPEVLETVTVVIERTSFGVISELARLSPDENGFCDIFTPSNFDLHVDVRIEIGHPDWQAATPSLSLVTTQCGRFSTPVEFGIYPVGLADADGDLIPNVYDVCPQAHNPDQTDTDGDGVGDDCEDDTDGDGLSDEDEAIMGTDATDPQDLLRITQNLQDDSLSFGSKSGRLYTLQRCSYIDATPNWTDVPGTLDIPGNGSDVTVYNVGDTETRFYRVIVRQP